MLQRRRVTLLVVFVLVIAAAGFIGWQRATHVPLASGFVSTNGRIEAEQINVATKQAGRLVDVLVDEGDFVTAGQVVAHMDDDTLKAQLAATEAELVQAQRAHIEAQAGLTTRRSELKQAESDYQRAQTLHQRGYFPTEQLEQRRTALDTARAAVDLAAATLARTAAAIDAAAANVSAAKTLLADTVLVAPRDGRVQYRLADPGEVLAAGGRVLSLLDLSDVQMIVFLPAGEAGRLQLGDEARLVLDPVPEYVIPARVSFVSGEAQFTPKMVEIREERDQLMFRIKLRIDPALLRTHQPSVKTGVRGEAWLRIAPAAQWPERLAVKLP